MFVWSWQKSLFHYIFTFNSFNSMLTPINSHISSFHPALFYFFFTVVKLIVEKILNNKMFAPKAIVRINLHNHCWISLLSFFILFFPNAKPKEKVNHVNWKEQYKRKINSPLSRKVFCKKVIEIELFYLCKFLKFSIILCQ
jgi:hypothetical protein